MQQSEADQLRNSSVVILETEAKPSFLPFCRVRLNIKKRKAPKPKNTSRISIRSSQISDAVISELNSNDSFSYQYINYESNSPTERAKPPESRAIPARNLGFKVKRPNLQNIKVTQIFKNDEESNQFNSELFRCTEKDFATQPFNSHRSGRLTGELGAKKSGLANYNSNNNFQQLRDIDDFHLEFDERRENERASIMNEELVGRNCKLVDEVYLLRELIALFGVKFDLPPGYMNIKDRIPDIKEKLEYFVNVEEQLNQLQHEHTKTLDRLRQQDEIIAQSFTEADLQQNRRSNLIARKLEIGYTEGDSAFKKSNKVSDELQTLATKLSECQDELFRSQNALEALKKKAEMNQILYRQNIIALEDSFRDQIGSLRQTSSLIDSDLSTFHELFIIMSRIRLFEKTKTLKIKKMEVIQNANDEYRKLLKSSSLRNIELADVVPLELRHSDLYETYKRDDNFDHSEIVEEDEEERDEQEAKDTIKFAEVFKMLEKITLNTQFSVKGSQEKLIHLNAQIQLLRQTFSSQLEKHKAKIQALEQDRSKLQFQNKNLLTELHILDEKAHVLITEKELLEDQLKAKDDAEEKYKELQLSYKMLENKLELINSFKEIGSHGYGNEEEKLKVSKFSSGDRRMTETVGLNGTIEEVEESQEDAESHLFHSKKYQSLGPSVLANSVINKRVFPKTLAIETNYTYSANQQRVSESDSNFKQQSHVLRTSKQDELDSPSTRAPFKLQKSRFMINESPIEPDISKSSNAGKKKLFDKNEILRSISELPKSLKSSQKQLERSDPRARGTRDYDRLIKNIQDTRHKLNAFSTNRFVQLMARITQFEVTATQKLASVTQRIQTLKALSDKKEDHNQYHDLDLHRQMDSVGNLKLVPQIRDLKQPSDYPKKHHKLMPIHKQNTVDKRGGADKLQLTRKSIAVPIVSSLFDSRGKSKSQKSLRAKKLTTESGNNGEYDDQTFEDLMNTFAKGRVEAQNRMKDKQRVSDIMPQFANLNIFKGKSVQDFESEDSNQDKKTPQALEVDPKNVFTTEEASPQLSTNKENDQPQKEKQDNNVYVNSICSDMEVTDQPLGYESFKPRVSSGIMLHSLKQESHKEFSEKINALEGRVREYEYSMSQLKTEIRDLEETLLHTNTRNIKLTCIVNDSYKLALDVLSQDSPNAAMFQPEDLPSMTETLCRNQVNLREILQTQNDEIAQLKKEMIYFATTLQNQSIDKGTAINQSALMMKNVSQSESRFQRGSLDESYNPSVRQNDDAINDLDSVRSSMRPSYIQFDRHTNDSVLEAKVPNGCVDLIKSYINPPDKRESFDEFKHRQEKIKETFSEIVSALIQMLHQNSHYLNAISERIERRRDTRDQEDLNPSTFRTTEPTICKITNVISNNESVKDIIEFIEKMLDALIKEFIDFKRDYFARGQQRAREDRGYESLGFEVRGAQQDLNSAQYASQHLEFVELDEMSSPHRLTQTESNTRVTALLGYSQSRDADHHNDESKRARTTNVLDKVRQGGHIMPNQEISELVLPRKDELNDFEKAYEVLLNIVFQFKRIMDAEDLNVEQKLAELYEMSEDINNL